MSINIKITVRDELAFRQKPSQRRGDSFEHFASKDGGVFLRSGFAISQQEPFAIFEIPTHVWNGMQRITELSFDDLFDRDPDEILMDVTLTGKTSLQPSMA